MGQILDKAPYGVLLNQSSSSLKRLGGEMKALLVSTNFMYRSGERLSFTRW